MSSHPEQGGRARLSAVPEAWDPGTGSGGADPAPFTDPDVPLQDWDGASYALFDADQGGLDAEQRRALVTIVKQRFISAETHPAEWKALLTDPDAVTTRLNDLFLTLHLDRDREVAWKRQAQPEGGGRPYPTLLYDAAWNREATIAMVFLRTKQRREAQSGNPTAFVDREDILDYIASARPASATDQSGDARRADRAIDDLYSAGLLRGRKTDDRFQIAGAIEALLPLDELLRLERAITAESNPAANAPDTNDTTGTNDATNDPGATEDPGATDDPGAHADDIAGPASEHDSEHESDAPQESA